MVSGLTRPKTRCYIILRNIVNVSGYFCLFSDINISQRSVAIRLRCGGLFYNSTARNLLLSLSVKEFCKLVSIWRS